MRVDTWVIKMTRHGFPGPYEIYYATPEFRRDRGSAARYESENAALHEAYGLKEAGLCISFEIEHIPADPPRRSVVQGTGGSA